MQNIGDVFHRIGGFLEHLVDFLPADQVVEIILVVDDFNERFTQDSMRSWDYLTVDEAARRVYVSHGTRVEVLDADTGERKGQVPDTKGVHGIAVAPDLGRGFTSNGQANNVTIFDLKTLKSLGEVATGKNPDCILYDPATKRIFAFNGRSGSAIRSAVTPARMHPS